MRSIGQSVHYHYVHYLHPWRYRSRKRRRSPPISSGPLGARQRKQMSTAPAVTLAKQGGPSVGMPFGMNGPLGDQSPPDSPRPVSRPTDKDRVRLFVPVLRRKHRSRSSSAVSPEGGTAHSTVGARGAAAVVRARSPGGAARTRWPVRRTLVALDWNCYRSGSPC